MNRVSRSLILNLHRFTLTSEDENPTRWLNFNFAEPEKAIFNWDEAISFVLHGQ